MRLRLSRVFVKQGIFGAADGATAVLGLLATLTPEPHALFKAALGVGVAELVGMTAGSWLSDDEEEGFLPALTNGAASLAACLAPALPYLVMSGLPAVIAAVVIILAIAAVITWLRPERGFKAVAETYGVLAVAAVATIAVSHL